MPTKKVDLTRILIFLRQARQVLDSGRLIAAKADDEPLTTRLTERVAVLDMDIQHVDALRGCDET